MNLQTIEKQMLICEEQLNKLKEGKKVAGTHARQSLLSVKKECDRLRKEILEHVKSMPPKTQAAAGNDVSFPVAEEKEDEIPPPLPLTREKQLKKKK